MQDRKEPYSASLVVFSHVQVDPGPASMRCRGEVLILRAKLRIVARVAGWLHHAPPCVQRLRTFVLLASVVR